MGLVRKSLTTVLVVAAIVVILRTNFVTNTCLLLTEPAFYLPEETNILTFEVLRHNPGSGDWWLFAADRAHHFAQARDDPRACYLIEKRDLPPGFRSARSHDMGGKPQQAGGQTAMTRSRCLRTTIFTVLATLVTAAAQATGEVYCEAPGSPDVTFSYGFGTVPGIAIISASIHAEGQHWSTIGADSTIPISLAQASLDDRRTIIDLADPNFERIVASVRLLSAVEGEDSVTVGILRIPGTGVFALVCV